MKTDTTKLALIYEAMDYSYPVDDKFTGYDFGSGVDDLEYSDNTIMNIDIEPTSSNAPNYIQADLSKPIKLPPKETIHTNQVAKYIKNLEQFANNIYNALLPGGVVNIMENYYNGWPATLKLASILMQKYHMKDISEYEAVGDELKAIGYDRNKLENMSAKDAANLDNMYDNGEFEFAPELVITLKK